MLNAAACLQDLPQSVADYLDKLSFLSQKSLMETSKAPIPWSATHSHQAAEDMGLFTSLICWVDHVGVKGLKKG